MRVGIVRLLVFAAFAAMLPSACGGGGGGSSVPSAPASTIPSPSSASISVLNGQGGSFTGAIAPNSLVANFIVQSASQPATPRLANVLSPAGLAVFPVSASENAGLPPPGTSAIARRIADLKRQIVHDAIRELRPRADFASTIAALPRAHNPETAIRFGKANQGDRRTFKVQVNAGPTAADGCPVPVANYSCTQTVTATLEAVSQHAYVWVDNDALSNPGEFPDSSYFATAAANFDRYYATETSAFGPAFSPANVTQYAQCDSSANPLPTSKYETIPDMTGADPHVSILVTDVVAGSGESGYFFPGDLLPQNVLNCSAIPRSVSNELPLIVIGGDNYIPDSQSAEFNPPFWLNTDMPRLLSHELQHYLHNIDKYYGPLATGRQTILDDAWIDEGCSMLAEDIAANGIKIDTPQYSFVYLLEPSAYSLTSFVGYQPDPTLDYGPYVFQYYTAGNYGAAYLFMRYVYDRFGGANALHALYGDFRAGTTGQSNVNPVLAAAGNTETWGQLAAEWAIAVAAQSTGTISDARFAFDPQIVLRGTVTIPSRRASPLQVRTLVFGGPQPPELFDPSGNLIGYAGLGTATSASIQGLDGAANFFLAPGVPGGATVKAQAQTLNGARAAIVQGNLPTPSPATF